MKKLRKTNGGIWLILIVAITLFMTACSNNEDDAATEEGDTNGSDDTENEITDEDIAGDLEIQYFVGGYGDEWWKEVIEDFKAEYPNVNVIEHAGPDINTEMNPRWISSDPPDIVYIDGAGFQ